VEIWQSSDKKKQFCRVLRRLFARR